MPYFEVGVTPTGSYLKAWIAEELDIQDYLLFSSDAPFTIKRADPDCDGYWEGILEYSTNGGEWIEISKVAEVHQDMEAAHNTSTNKYELRMRGEGNTIVSWDYDEEIGNGLQIEATEDVTCSGNIMCLLSHTKVAANQTNIPMGENAFCNLFANCSKLTTSPELPATILTEYCYNGMLQGTGIVDPPDLPATTLAEGCYGYLFENCTLLTTMPKLPAKTLQNSCYFAMFRGCTSLTVAAELPAVVLSINCYRSMFENCTSLLYPPIAAIRRDAEGSCRAMFKGSGLARRLKNFDFNPQSISRYACYEMFANCSSLMEILSLTETEDCDNYGCYRMYQNCTALTTVTPIMDFCGQLWSYGCAYMFEGCTNLTTTPFLRYYADTPGCMEGTFKGCTHLTTIAQVYTTDLATNSLKSMFENCSSLRFGNKGTEYRIPIEREGTAAAGALTDIIKGTGGVLQTLEINTTVVVSATVI